MSFRVLSAILASLLGIATIVTAVAADVTGRARLAIATGVLALLLVVVVLVRFIVLG